MPKVIVNVMLKEEILDPQGDAISEAIKRIGIGEISTVRQGKRFELHYEVVPTEEEIARISEIATTLLSNSVIETFEISVEKSA